MNVKNVRTALISYLSSLFMKQQKLTGRKTDAVALRVQPTSDLHEFALSGFVILCQSGFRDEGVILVVDHAGNACLVAFHENILVSGHERPHLCVGWVGCALGGREKRFVPLGRENACGEKTF